MIRVLPKPPYRTVASYVIFSVLVAFAAWSVFEPPISRRAAFYARLDELRELDARSSQVVASSAASIEAQAALEALEAPARYLRGETAQLAAAALQDHIRAVLQHEDGVLVSAAVRSADTPSPLTPVKVSARLKCSTEALVNLLYALERSEAELFVTKLSIQSRHREGRELQDIGEELDVELEITGYLDEPTTHEPQARETDER